MARVEFLTAQGERVTVDAAEGENLLAVAQRAGMPLEGTCEGQMACSTCHVVIATEWFDRLKPASADEEDMLDLAAGVTRTSRLACQIEISEALEGLEVRIPDVFYDMQKR